MKIVVECRSGLRVEFDGDGEELDRFDRFLGELAQLERDRLQPGDAPAPDAAPIGDEQTEAEADLNLRTPPSEPTPPAEPEAAAPRRGRPPAAGGSCETVLEPAQGSRHETSQRHRVELTFDDGVRGRLICPEHGCTAAAQCSECYRDLSDDTAATCYDCKDAKPGECWVKSWFDNLMVEELLHGSVTVEIDPDYDFDHLVARIVKLEEQPVAADDPLRVTIWICSECEKPGTSEAWQRAWDTELRRRRTAPEFAEGEDEWGVNLGLTERMVCPSCGRVHSDDETSFVDETFALALTAKGAPSDA